MAEWVDWAEGDDTTDWVGWIDGDDMAEWVDCPENGALADCRFRGLILSRAGLTPARDKINPLKRGWVLDPPKVALRVGWPGKWCSGRPEFLKINFVTGWG